MSQVKGGSDKADREQLKKALIERRLRGGDKRSPEVKPIPKRPDAARAELSFSQRRLWILDQLEPGNPIYNLSGAFRIVGRLDEALLERCLLEIHRRHETLRTTFSTIDGNPVQLISPFARFSLPLVDLRTLPESERAKTADRMANDLAQQSFDLSRGPLVRSSLIRLAEEEHILVLSMHHIISDGWSIEILLRELSSLFNAFSRGEESPLRPLLVHYGDFSDWQRRSFEEKLLEPQLEYWRNQLGGELIASALATDWPRPSFQTYAGAVATFQIGEELTAALTKSSRAHGVTLFMLLLAAFKVLLYRCTRQTDVVVGSDIAGRNRLELENLIGFFVNTLVLKTDLSGNPSFRELLGRVRDVTLGAYANQDVPFERLVEVLQPERDASRTPLFQVMFSMVSFQHQVKAGQKLGDLTTLTYELERNTSQFDLSLEINEAENQLIGAIEYNTDLFERNTVARLKGHLLNLLEAVAANAETRIDSLPLLTDAERERLVYGLNDTAVEFDSATCFNQVFERQVERAPLAIAAVCNGERLSYRELNSRANRVAHQLASQGAGPEAVVLLLDERGLNLLTLILGVFKTGAAYLPLDPLHPPKRLTQVISESKGRLLVASEPFLSVISEAIEESDESARPQLFVAEKLLRQDAPDSNLNIDVGPNNLAYVIFTSGSTGVPKGAMVEQAGMLNHLYAKIADLHLNSFDIIAQTASQCFDISVWQFLSPLAVGGQVLFVDDRVALDPPSLIKQVGEQRVSVLELVPSMIRAVLEELDKQGALYRSLSSLRWLIATGEALPPDLFRKWSEVYPEIPMVNAYGPTECSDDVTHYFGGARTHQLNQIPIGRPIANIRAHILDPQLQPVPVGVAGELFIGGIGVGRGYINRRDITSVSFIPDPFSNQAGARLYRTGDLACYLPSGDIAFLGRVDHQVKIRGARIELREIEALLCQHEAVNQAAVVARENGPTGKRIVAYYTAKKSAPASAIELRQYLKNRLPEYMIPTAFVPLEAFPLTPNGKLDYRSLHAPAFAAPDAEEDFAPPENPVEEILVGIWADVLQVERVGIRSNFFEMGGHSLLATQVISRVREEFDVEIPLRRFFESPTVASLAQKIAQAQKSVKAPSLLPIRRIPRGDDLPLSFAQQRLWFLDQYKPDSSLYNMSEALRLKGSLDAAVLERSLNEIIRRHEALRTIFIQREGRPVQQIRETMRLPLAIIDLAELSPAQQQEEIIAIALKESQTPFDLATGPLLRAMLLKIDSQECVLLFSMHHIISDGWSVRVFIRELTAIYRAFTASEPSPLEELPVQYVDFAHWQREWLCGDVLEAQLAYWRTQLADVPALQLPTDRARPAVQTFNGAHQTLKLDTELLESIKTLSRSEGVTLFMTLLAAFQTLLLRYAGQEKIAVGTPIANRTRAEIEPLIGFLVNTLVMCVNLGGNPTFRELLRRVREVALGAYAHQDLPFEKLVEELRPERNLSHQPLFQVMFVLQNAPGEDLELPGLTIRRVEVETRTSKFDVILFAWEEVDGLMLWVDYNTDLFDKTTITRMLGHLQALVQGAVDNPGQHIWDLPMATSKELGQMLVEWNRTNNRVVEGECIHRLIEEQVRKTPGSIAAVFENDELTYEELNRRANRVARYLQRRGVGPDSLVGICLDRSLDMLISLLAIIKAGGAAVALDRAYPEDRLTHIVQDAQMAALFAEDGSVNDVLGQTTTIICPRSDREEIAREDDADPVSAVTPQNLLYAIYTSGSTGLPKGVGVTHQAFFNLLEWQREYSGLRPNAKTLQFATFGFCVSFQEIFSTWCGGDTLFMISEEKRTDITGLLGLIENYSIERLYVPFAALKHLAEINHTEMRRPSSLREIITAGEQLQITPSIQRFFHALVDCSLNNQYGASETHVVCSFSLQSDPSNWPTIPPVGRPISNVQIYILDRYLRPVPVGIPGEICASGACLPRGYVSDPELTALKLTPNPFSNEPGSRLYRTGDLAVYLPDGNIKVIGRLDHQIKIRGFRIEPGEIEAVLRKCPQVKDAAIAVNETESGYKRLVAYLVLTDEKSYDADRVRDFLKTKLPEYMIPWSFITLSALPLNANGKLDYSALPAPQAAELNLSKELSGPRNQVEATLVNIWAKVLGTERVGIFDNFFDLGGHSLLATQLISSARDAFKVELSLRRLFEFPTVASLAKQIDSATVEDLGFSAPPIIPMPRDRELPLSFAQQRLWFLDQLEPGSTRYNIRGAVRVKGVLNISAFEKSVDAIIRRHESFRTTFHSERGRAVQTILPAANLRLPLIDLQPLPSSEQESEVVRISAEEANSSFDLSRGPLFRVMLLRLGERDHIVLLTMHHIISDGWSMGIVIQDLENFYHSFSNGIAQPDQGLEIQYADFAYWQKQWLQGELLDREISYWRSRLGGALPSLELPTDRVKPPYPTYRGAICKWSLDKVLSEDIARLSRRQAVTVFMTLLAAFKTLLMRYSGQNEIVVGSPIAGRNRSEIEGLVGFFVNMLALRSTLSPDLRFTDFLRQVRDITLGAYAHQDVPFEKLVEELQPERNINRSPIFQAVFILQNVPHRSSTLKLSELSIEPFELPVDTANFELILELEETEQGLAGGLIYNADLFDAQSIERMSANFRTLLKAIVEEPDSRLFELPIISASERRLLLSTWNSTENEYTQGLTVHELIELQARRRQTANAAIFANEQLTYEELNQRANQLARHLRALGVRPGVFVGISFPRSLEMLVGLLGVLKSGGAYVPLDPEAPPQRLESMIEQAQVEVLLTSESLRHLFVEPLVKVICLDSEWSSIADKESDNLQGAVTLDDVAYLIYTSGSTGVANGVAVSHKNMLHSIRAHLIYYREPVGRLMLIPPVAFDSSVTSIYWTLCSGGCVVIPEDGAQRDVSKLASLIRDYSISHWISVPSLYSALIEYTDPASLAPLRVVIMAGEECRRELVEQHRRQVPQAVLFNEYGPTECSVWSTVYDCTEWTPGNRVPIGMPIPNWQIYLLDQRLQPVPIGVSGELHIGGEGVSCGYKGQPDLTAQRFIPDQFSGKPGARLYKTGDIARYRSDGNVEFLGRNDFQVKIRGFRIELEEIEAQLDKHPAVKQSLVIVSNGGGADQLVAYIVAVAGLQLSNDEIKKFLRGRLPDYMVPHRFIFIDKFPLTPNGKVDRSAIRLHEPTEKGLDERAELPGNEVANGLMAIWAEVLKTHPQSTQDDFFSLGGHSLLIPQMMSKIQESFGVELPAYILFDCPTIEELAREIISSTPALKTLRNARTNKSVLVGMNEEGGRAPFFCVHPAGGFVYEFASLAQLLGPDQPFYAIQSRGLDDGEGPLDDIKDIAAHYVKAVRSIRPEGPYLLGGWSMGGLVALEMANNLLTVGQEVSLVALLDTYVASSDTEDKLSDLAGEFTLELARVFGKLATPAIENSFREIVSKDSFNKLAQEDQLNRLINQAQVTGLLPEEFDHLQAHRLFGVLSANIRAAKRYRPAKIPPNVILIRAGETGNGASPPLQDDLINQVSSAQVYTVPGDHYSMMREPCVRVLAEYLRASLNKADRLFQGNAR